jgi:Holliday junction resolvasome RuvABC ATP-dependent DNA helicase subunit
MIADKEITCLFDEASELPHDVTMALLTILQPNQENSNQFSYEDYTVDFNFARQTFLFCTSETHRIFSPLLDRLERINLESYSHSQLEEIVKRNLPGVEFEPSALNGVSSVLRGNARSAQKMANDIKSYLGGSQVFMLEDWSKMKYELGINDLGLSPIEIQVLRILRDHKETSLTRLSAVTGLSRESLQKDAEMYLQNLDLMGISTLGRYLTGKGFAYLKGLAA